MRALAAFAVLAGHVRGLYFVDYSDLRNPSVFAQVSYMVTGLGHQSVIVFFVLSGFFIGYSVLVARQTGRSNPRDYAIRRFARIYVVLVPALIATFLVDSLGIELFGTAGTVYGGEVNAPFLDLPNVPEQLGLGAFLANLFQLQSILDFPEYGTNGPLWSLPYEAWAYAIFPLGLVAHVRPLRTGTVVRVLAVVGLFVLGGRLLCLYCTIWLMGAAVSWWWVRSERSANDPAVSRLVPLVALVVFLALTIIGRGRLLGSRALEDLALGVSTALLIGAQLRASRHRDHLDRRIVTTKISAS
jgi:peptidoglycan/LPS O-acetylase OafA/YrhL